MELFRSVRLTLVRVKFDRSVSVNYYQYNALIINQLLADAEVGEDGVEEVGGGDLAGYCA